MGHCNKTIVNKFMCTRPALMRPNIQNAPGAGENVAGDGIDGFEYMYRQKVDSRVCQA